jgi:hypothetical protein
VRFLLPELAQHGTEGRTERRGGGERREHGVRTHHPKKAAKRRGNASDWAHGFIL